MIGQISIYFCYLIFDFWQFSTLGHCQKKSFVEKKKQVFFVLFFFKFRIKKIFFLELIRNMKSDSKCIVGGSIFIRVFGK